MGTALARNVGTASVQMAKARHLVSPGQRHEPLPPPQRPVLVFGGGSGPPKSPPQTPKLYVPPVPQYMIGLHVNVVPPSSKGAIKDAD
jgi:hypothetical protein